MTMSHLLKQTKKCCSKIIRKFSFHPNGGGPSTSSSSNRGAHGDGGHGTNSSLSSGGGRSISLNNRATAKYVLHKNCTPTRCQVQPTTPERFATGGPSWLSTTDEDSPVRRRLDLSPKPEPEIPATQNNYRVTRDDKNQRPKKRTNITSNKNVNLRKCFRLRKGFKDELSGADGGEEMNNSSSVVASKLDKISKTLYNVAGGGGSGDHDGDVNFSENKLFGGVNANNLASQTSEKSKISKPLFLSGKLKKYNQIETQFGGEDGLDYDDDDDDELVACEMDAIRAASNSHDGGRLQFELSQPLPEVYSSPLPGRSCHNDGSYEEIVFEKVRYEPNKRYLRNGTSSPSTASNRSHTGSYVAAHSADSILSINFECKAEHPLTQYAVGVNSKSEDFIDPWRNYNVNSRWNKVAKNPWEVEAQKVDSPAMSPRPSWNPFADESSPMGSPSAHQPSNNNNSSSAKVYPPPYQVRTDIWQNLNNKNYEIDSDVVWRTSNSSRRTSASTVETWIEDEVFDNSFNEELERRCATLQI